MINVILTVWKRNNLEEQLEMISKQTADISDVYVYQNESHFDISHLKSKYNFKHVHSKDMNFKFHGRFTLPLLFNSEYTVVFDDDVISGPKWLEHCVEVSKKRNCIVGANGRNYNTQHNCDCCGFNNEDWKVDSVGHCWFFKTEWIHYMWRDPAVTFENGEDIQLCAACKVYGNIDSYFPRQSQEDPMVWGDLKQQQLGTDEHASYKRTGHGETREKLFEHWMSKGWKVK
jgi:hypothetical protein